MADPTTLDGRFKTMRRDRPRSGRDTPEDATGGSPWTDDPATTPPSGEGPNDPDPGDEGPEG